MDKKQWKTVAISAATLLLLFLLVIWVFRDHYQEILRNIQAVSIRELLLLLGMGLAYQMLESAEYLGKIVKSFETLHFDLPISDVSSWYSQETINESIMFFV